MPNDDIASAARLERTATAWRRYKRLMLWMACLAVVAVLLALLYLRQSGGSVPIHMLIATIAGVGFSVLLGTALMGLVYFSNNSGHDDGAHQNTLSQDAHDDAESRKADTQHDDRS